MSVELASLKRHQDKLLALDKTTRNALKAEMRTIGAAVANRAKRNASWSTRIPGSIKVRTRLTGKRPGVIVLADASKAPHARPYEDIEGRGAFRHPVFGHEDRWVPQRSRPFLAPALRAELPSAKARLAEAVSVYVNKEL